MPSSRLLEYHGIIGYLLVRVALICTQISISFLVVSGVVAGEEYGLETICSHIEQSKSGMAPLCKKDLMKVQQLSPLIQKVTPGNNSLDDLIFYPSSFLVRPRLQEDSFDDVSSRPCETEQDAMTIVRISDTDSGMIRPQQVRVLQLSDYIVNENDNNNHQRQRKALVDDTFSLKLRRRRRQSDPVDVDMVVVGAQKFHRCCLDSIPKENKTNSTTNDASFTRQDATSIHLWKQSDSAKRCKEIGEHAFADISQQLASLITTKGQQDDKNQLLRRVVAVWGSPRILAHLVLVFGCTSLDAYDEFNSCFMQIHDLDLNVNVHQRSVDPLEPGAWACNTCTIHQHPRWYASYVVAGKLTYTMVQPNCPAPTDMLSPLSMVEELEKESQITGTSLIDTLGTRFHMHSTDVVWDTTEVVQLMQGQSLVFSPLWYHRVVPPVDNATHAAVTFLAKFNRERSIGDQSNQGQRGRDHRLNYLLIPEDITPENSPRPICYRLLDLYDALLHPELDVQRGLELFPCTNDTMHTVSDVNDFNTLTEGVLHKTQNDKPVTDTIDSNDEDDEEEL